MTDQRREIDENYDYFERNLARFLETHRGEYVLLRDRTEIAFYSRPFDAYRDALQQYPDQRFSIQEVTERPLDLGFLSIA